MNTETRVNCEECGECHVHRSSDSEAEKNRQCRALCGTVTERLQQLKRYIKGNDWTGTIPDDRFASYVGPALLEATFDIMGDAGISTAGLDDEKIEPFIAVIERSFLKSLLGR